MVHRQEGRARNGVCIGPRDIAGASECQNERKQSAHQVGGHHGTIVQAVPIRWSSRVANGAIHVGGGETTSRHCRRPNRPEVWVPANGVIAVDPPRRASRTPTAKAIAVTDAPKKLRKRNWAHSPCPVGAPHRSRAAHRPKQQIIEWNGSSERAGASADTSRAPDDTPLRSDRNRLLPAPNQSRRRKTIRRSTRAGRRGWTTGAPRGGASSYRLSSRRSMTCGP